ncbi:MAG: RNA polymerase sigma factor [Deltaproteobacteria bacterium]|nr:MAG: RNA polymerase sigma factor [Deltaproteobacteria bacterium]
MASTGSVKRLANTCVTVTRATKPEISTATSVCWSGQAPSGLPPGPIASSVPEPGMGFSCARAGPPPRRIAVRIAMAVVRGCAVFFIDDEVCAPREIGSPCVTGVRAGVFAPAVPSGRIGAAVDKDWLAVLGRLLAGDRVAFLEVNRLVTGFLVQLRAYDFRDEWDDLRQEVLLSVVANARAGRLRDPKAFVGYVRIITRNKFIDRLKVRLRHHEKEALPWDEETARAVTASAERDGRARELWSAVRDLPPEEQRVLDGVYRQGKTYEQVCAETGLPLGTMKRRLRDGLLALRRRFAEDEP